MAETKEKAEKPKEKSKTIKAADIEKKVVELGKQNVPPAKIGLIIRDQHGISKSKLFGKKITAILKAHKIPFENEVEHTQRKQEKLKKHFEKNKHDYPAKKAIFKYTGKIHKLKKQAA